MAARRSTVFDTGEAPMDLQSGIVSTANALGMDPLVLATIISYETGGTFNPTQGGPTTKWGKHRGLIQFGEPQAKQYGVDWNDPLGSQLGPNGAVVKYFQGSGWQPGMGMLDAYSIINAGGPGRYNARDAASGGAPGTVRDKVEQQMGGHRHKAAALLGGGYAAEQNDYDPRSDTPSSGKSVGSELPGPPTSPYSLDSPSETGGARFGGEGLGTPTAAPTVADASTGKWDKVGEAISTGVGGFADRKSTPMGAGGKAPQMPATIPATFDPVPITAPGQEEARRQLAEMMYARLKSRQLGA
jgi:hypothetical protein